MVNVGTDRSRAKGSTFSNALSDSINQAWNENQSTNQAWNDAQATNSSFSQGQSGSENQAFNREQSATDSFNRGLTGSAGTSSQNVWAPQQGALQSIYGQAGNLAAGRGQTARDVAGVNRSARSAWEQSLQPGGNPYFSQNVQGAIDQATQNFKRQVIPGMTEAGVGAGAYGTSRDALARGEAAGLAQQGISQMVGGMYSDQYASDEARRSAALGMAPQMQAMQYGPLSAAAGIVGGPTVLGQSQNTSYGNTYGGSTGRSSGVGGSTGSSYGNTLAGSTGQSTSAGGSYGQSSGEGGSYGLSSSSAQGGGVNSSKNDSYKLGVLSK